MTQPPLKTISQDQHIVVSGTWEQFKSIQKGFEHSRGVRLSYCLCAKPIPDLSIEVGFTG